MGTNNDLTQCQASQWIDKINACCDGETVSSSIMSSEEDAYDDDYEEDDYSQDYEPEEAGELGVSFNNGVFQNISVHFQTLLT